MATIDELRKTRIEKLKKLQDAGILAYPAKTGRTHTIAEALESFGKLSKSSCIFSLFKIALVNLNNAISGLPQGPYTVNKRSPVVGS